MALASSPRSFKSYVSQFVLRTNGTNGTNTIESQLPQVQTHTWFSPTRKTTKLHVPADRSDEFLEHVFSYITQNDDQLLEDIHRGENSITEKVQLEQDRFRLFADVDFKVSLFEAGHLPRDRVTLIRLMSDLVRIYDEIVAAVFSAENVLDRIVAVRLPYKLHLVYPSVIVNQRLATTVAAIFASQLKEDPRFRDALAQDPNIVDTSVYRTGLRMVGMHGSLMKTPHKIETECRAHELLFPSTYQHRYKIVDVDTFRPVQMSLKLYKDASILAQSSDDYTEPIADALEELTANLHPILFGKSKSASKGKQRGASITSDARDTSGTVHGEKLQVVDGQPLLAQLSATLKYMVRTYNHLICEEKIFLKRFTLGETAMFCENENDAVDPREGATGEKVQSFLVFPLTTKECHFAGRVHEGNHQYLLIDHKGSRQKCHDCPESVHKPLKPGRFPATIKNELHKLGVITSDTLAKNRRKKAPTHEERMNAVESMLVDFRKMYPKNELKVDPNRVIMNETGLCIGLLDLYCQVCNRMHGEPCTHMFVMETGKAFVRCDQAPFGSFSPNPPLAVPQQVKSLLFHNCNISITQTVINNYNDSTGDVGVDFIEEPVFDDEALNHLIYESLTGNTWPIVKVIHYLGRDTFDCTKEGIWYVFKHHRWIQNSEGAFAYFISEKVSDYYREARDYYRENTADSELRGKQVSHLQKIIDKLTNIKPKTDIIKEAKNYFYEEDFYRGGESGEVHFEKRLDEHRHLLCFTNGVYDLDADHFREGSPHDFITLCVGYDFPTQPDPEKHKIVEKFFADMQPDEEEREYLLLFLSSLIHGMTKEETFHIFTGGAANGKSLLRDLVMRTLGEYFENIPANLLTRERPASSSPQPEIVKLKGKRAVFGSEPEQQQKINTGFVKWITGNDPLKARLLNSNELVEFLPHFKLVLLCNDIPLMDSNDFGTWRRSRIKVFPVTFMDKPRRGNKYEKPLDEGLKQTIPDCKGEFMLYLMQYFRKYRNMKRLRPTTQVLQMVEKHKRRSNNLMQFIDECTVEAPGHGILLSDLYPKYRMWMQNELPGEQPMIKSKIIEEIQKLKNVDYTRYCRVQGRKGGGQQGIKGRKIVENGKREAGCGNEDGDLDDGEALQDGSEIQVE